MDKVGCMRAFVAVVEAEGFSAAAKRSGQSKALLSKYVMQLEAQLKVRLLSRTTRRVTATTEGEAYYAGCRQLLDELDELDARLQERHSQPRGELRVSAPVHLAEMRLIPLLGDFLRQYPEVRLAMQLSDRMVDVVDERIDLAIRIADLPDSSLVARKLAPVRIIACAAPAYLQQFGQPRHPAELGRFACILDTNISDSGRWSFMDQGELVQVPVTGQITVNSAIAVRALVVQGHGIALSPDFVVADDIAAGRLICLLEEFEPRRHFLYAVYPHRRHLSAKVRCFIDFLAEGLAETDARGSG